MENKILKSDQVIFFDCDDTLVEWVWDPIRITDPIIQAKLIDFTTPFHREREFGRKLALLPIEDSINLMKAEKARGMTIVVWSAGGWEWAAEVVKGLQLDNYVDLIMSKPMGYVDDLNSSQWMGQYIRVRKGKISDYQKKQLARGH